MLYDCENVRTLTYGAKINTPPMKAFRAPGFVEGTFGLECIVDALAAKLDMDPLELRAPQLRGDERGRRRSPRRSSRSATSAPSRTGSGATRCARGPTRRGSAASGWRARSGTAAAGLLPTPGCASAPTAAPRSITAMQDIGTGTKTAMAQIAAEELRLPLDRVDVVARRLGARAVRVDLGRLVDDCRRWGRRCAPLPPTRASRFEIAAQRYDRGAIAEQRGDCPRDATWLHERSSTCSRTRRSSARAPAARTRPA